MPANPKQLKAEHSCPTQNFWTTSTETIGSAVLASGETELHKGGQGPPLLVIMLVFFSTLFGYSLQNISQRDIHNHRSNQILWSQSNNKLIKLIVFVSFLISVFLSFYIMNIYLIILSIPFFGLVFFLLLGWSRGPGEFDRICFGLFWLLGWSRRPGECDRIWFGLFGVAWLIEKAGRVWSYFVWFILWWEYQVWRSNSHGARASFSTFVRVLSVVWVLSALKVIGQWWRERRKMILMNCATVAIKYRCHLGISCLSARAQVVIWASVSAEPKLNWWACCIVNVLR